MPNAGVLTIAPDVKDVLARAAIVGRSVVLPPGTLDRALYVKVNKVLELAGGKWNRKAKAHEFADVAGLDAFTAALGSGNITDTKKSHQQFFTPTELAQRIVIAANIQPMMTVLEPSAGAGYIALMVRQVCPSARIQCVEIDPKLVDTLKGYNLTVVCADFMEWTPELRVDRVVMNPPFTKNQDIAHITRAFGFLQPGGRLVAVAGAGAATKSFKANRAFRELVDAHGSIVDLPEGSFSESGTMVNTVLVTLNA